MQDLLCRIYDTGKYKQWRHFRWTIVVGLYGDGFVFWVGLPESVLTLIMPLGILDWNMENPPSNEVKSSSLDPCGQSTRMSVFRVFGVWVDSGSIHTIDPVG